MIKTKTMLAASFLASLILAPTVFAEPADKESKEAHKEQMNVQQEQMKREMKQEGNKQQKEMEHESKKQADAVKREAQEQIEEMERLQR